MRNIIKIFAKKSVFLIIFCTFAVLSCKTQDNMENLFKNIPIIENQTQLSEKTYEVFFNQLIYVDNKPYRNLGNMKITFLDNNKIIFHQINFLFITPFDIKLREKLRENLREEAIENIILYFKDYSIEIGTPIYVNIAKAGTYLK